MTVQQPATRWVHQPHRGPVSWGAAVLVVPMMPLLSFFAMVLLDPLFSESRDDLRTLVSPVPWLVLGVLVAGLASHRVSRGIGVGLACGGATAVLMAVMATYGGWQS